MSFSRLRPYHALMLRAVVASALLAAIVGVTPGIARAAATAPYWRLEGRAAPTSLPLKGEGVIAVTLANLGALGMNEGGHSKKIEVTDTLPAGVEVKEVKAQSEGGSLGRENFPSENEERIRSPKKPEGWGCENKFEPGKPIKCEYGLVLPPYQQLELVIHVTTDVPAATTLVNEVSVEGGEAKSVTLHQQLPVTGATPEFGIAQFESTPEEADGTVDTQAGSDPFQYTTTFNLDDTLEFSSGLKMHLPAAVALQKEVSFKLPPGLVANPNAVPQCEGVAFGALDEHDINACPDDTAVGTATVAFNDPIDGIGFTSFVVPVFNLKPPPGEPAQLGFEANNVPIVVNTAVRTGEDYGATVTVEDASQSVQVLGSRVTIWGVPADVSHEHSRGWNCLDNGSWVGIRPCLSSKSEEGKAPTPFLMLPTSCGEMQPTVSGRSWPTPASREGIPLEETGEIANGQALTPTTLTECGKVPFASKIAVKPDEHTASTPTGLTVEVEVPQANTLTEGDLAEADIKSTTLELPAGLQTSPGAANGLLTCSAGHAEFTGGQDTDTGSVLTSDLERQSFSSKSPEQRELGQEASCPNEAKIGEVEVTTPLLRGAVKGWLYLAAQDTNPFGSPLVLYLIAEEPTSKVLVKLAGEVEINPNNGQLISRFKNTPQTPFEKLKLHLFNGKQVEEKGKQSIVETDAQTTPAFCGAYEARAQFTTYSKEPAAGEEADTSVFEINGPNCTAKGQKLPFQPGFQAGSTNSQAAAFTPFTLAITRPDGDQTLKSVSTETPPGLAAILASVTPCPEAQALEAACGAGSLVGHSGTSSGLGNAPYNLSGSAYLMGPYHGAPYGIAVVTPVQAGPFNVGTVIALSTITINPTTAAATIETIATRLLSPSGVFEKEFAGLPEFIKGVPAQIKQLNVTVDRPNFEFNPTNCSKLAVSGKLTGGEGAEAAVSTPFFASNCAGLPFAPKLSASVVGHGSKANGTEFRVTVESPGLGQANIHKVDLAIPTQLSSRLSTLQQACLEKVFNVNPASCDAGSVIGTGIVRTPVFNKPLEGPAYLVAHGGAEFPDVEFVLQGENGVKVILDGQTRIKNGVTFSKFETAPDAPFTKFETILPAGPHSAFTPNVPEKEAFSLCKTSLAIPTEITGQNGKFISESTNVVVTGCGEVKGTKSHKLTRAQLLAKALKACKKNKKKSKRVACEKLARRKYGPHAKKGAKKR